MTTFKIFCSFVGFSSILNILRNAGTFNKTAGTVFKLHQVLFTCKKYRTFDDICLSLSSSKNFSF